MKITNLTLEGWRSYVHAEIPLSRYTFVRGGNANGKSSIADAIQYALAGRNDSTDARGAGAKDLIRPGSDKATIGLDIESPDFMGKFRTRLSDKSGRGTAFNLSEGSNEHAEVWLAKNIEVFNILCNSRHFVEKMKPDEQKAFLAGIILPDFYEWPEAMRDAVTKAQLAVDLQGKPFDVISKVYDLAFSARTAINRDIKNFAFPGGDVTMAGSVDAINSKLSSLRMERDGLVGEKSAAGEKVREASGRKAAINTKIIGLEQRASQYDRELTAAAPNILSKKALAENDKKAAGAKRVAEITGELKALEAQSAQHEAALKKINELSSKPICPTCQRAVDADMIETIAAPIVDSVTKVRDKMQDLHNEQLNFGDIMLAAQAIRSHQEATNQVERAKERKKEVEDQIAVAKKELAAIQVPDAPDTTEIDEKIAALDERIRKGLEHHTLVTQASERKRLQEEAGKRKKAMEEKQANLEKLVTFFGPKGIQAQLLADSVEPFIGKMNTVLLNWGYQCEFSFEPYQFGVRGNVEGSPFRQLRVMSKSEKLRFGVAFQVAIAVISGLKFVIVDEADMLDLTGRQALVKGLIQQNLDQFIVLQTDEKRPEKMPKDPNFSFFMVSSQDDDQGVPTSTVERVVQGV